MLKALNTAASGMQAQQNSLDTIANNLSNVNTTGFKKSRAEFEDLLYQTVKEPGVKNSQTVEHPTGVQVGLGVKTAAVQKMFEQGSLRQTRNPLDVAVIGKGFFPIQMNNGEVGYTRDGSFHKDGGGRIVDKNGYPIIPEIVVPPEATAVNIDDKGAVSFVTRENNVPQQLGQIQLVDFVNPAGLKSVGKNLFVPSPASGTPIQGVPGENGIGMLSQGELEGSNVNVVDEMVEMIRTQRNYETSSKVVQAADQMLQYSNNLR